MKASATAQLKEAHKRRNEVESGIAACRQAIDKARQKIDDETPDIELARALRQQLEDAAAAAAVGAPSHEDIGQLTEAVRRAEERAAQSRNELEKAALPGLLRRIETLAAQTGDLDHEIRAIVQIEMEAERDAILGEYLKAAEIVATCVACLRALVKVADERSFFLGPIWRGIQPPVLPIPVLNGEQPKFLEGGDNLNVFGNLLIERMEQKARPSIASRYDELLGA